MWKIIYEDEQVIVCDKPAGVAVQSRRIDRQDLEGMARSYLMKQSGRRDVFVAAVHRLDQPVEGLVLMAKTKKAAGTLSAQMQDGLWTKKYLAVIQGQMPQERGILENYITRDAKTQMAYITQSENKDARYARLEYAVLETCGNRQLVEITLFTGRYHQIRVQFAHAGYPLVGDARYNPDKTCVGRGPALCAYTLAFVHPVAKKKMTFTKRPYGEFFRDFTYIKEMWAQ